MLQSSLLFVAQFGHNKCSHLMIEMISQIETTATNPPNTLNPLSYRRSNAIGDCLNTEIILPGVMVAVAPNRKRKKKNPSHIVRYSTVPPFHSHVLGSVLTAVVVVIAVPESPTPGPCEIEKFQIPLLLSNCKVIEYPGPRPILAFH
jgi:hypothetical protein